MPAPKGSAARRALRHGSHCLVVLLLELLSFFLLLTLLVLSLILFYISLVVALALSRLSRCFFGASHPPPPFAPVPGRPFKMTGTSALIAAAAEPSMA